MLCWQSLVVADIASIELSPALGLPGSYGYRVIALLLAVSYVPALAIRF